MSSTLASQERVRTIKIPGDLLDTTLDSARAQANQILGDVTEHTRLWDVLQLDLTAAEKVDSAGLHLIVGTTKGMHALGGTVRLVYSRPSVQRFALFAWLDTLVELVKV